MMRPNSLSFLSKNALLPTHLKTMGWCKQGLAVFKAIFHHIFLHVLFLMNQGSEQVKNGQGKPRAALACYQTGAKARKWMGQSENPVLESLEDRRKSCPSRFFLCYGVKHTHTHGSHIIVPCPRGNRGARKKERCSPNEVKECPENSLHHPHTHSHEYTHNPSRSPSPLEIMPPLS